MKPKGPSKTVAVLFGGRSAEHEISVITALQMVQALDPFVYTLVPVYIHPSGKWYTGKALLDKRFYCKLEENLTKLQRVTLLPEPGQKGLLKVNKENCLIIEGLIAIDVFFLAFHGQYGEDGCIQGLLELADVAYTGSGVSSSSVAMNKYLCKGILQAHGIPVLPSVVVRRNQASKSFESAIQQVIHTQGLERFPLFVKPSHLGSSIGISSVTNEKELAAGLANVFRYDDEAIIEPCLMQLMEINVAVLEGDPPQASVVEIPIATAQSLTYEDKYLRGGKKSSNRLQGMASLTRVIDPEYISTDIKATVINYALKAFNLLGCAGVGRFDFMFDKQEGQLYFNELNPIPGSFSFYLWEKCNPPILYTQLIERLIDQAILRKTERLALQREIGFKALQV